jgi:hypothetical protein
LELDINIPRPGQIRFDDSALRADPVRGYLLDKLGLQLPITHNSYRPYPRLIGEGKSLRYKPEILLLPPVGLIALEGYWQCEKYFLRVQDAIRREVFSGVTFTQKTLDVASGIRKLKESCFLHVRRTDNIGGIDGVSSKRVHGLLDMNYYCRTADFIRDHVPGVHFFIFSDDPAWVCKTISWHDATIVDCNPMSGICDSQGRIRKNQTGREHEDLWLMSLCKHGILANSTFGWWGAWLNPREPTHDRIVVAPQQKGWFAQQDEWHDSTDIIPEHWVRL